LKEQLEEAEKTELAKQQMKLAHDLARAWVSNNFKPPIERRWIKPPTARNGLSCIIQITVLPGGEVDNAHVISSSGDSAFDRSAEAAVLKASPLPWPSDAKVAQVLRSEPVKITFSPD